MTPFAQRGSGLWLSAFFVALLGGVITYTIHLNADDLLRETHMALAGMITVIASGILAICASAHWWMRR